MGAERQSERKVRRTRSIAATVAVPHPGSAGHEFPFQVESAIIGCAAACMYAMLPFPASFETGRLLAEDAVLGMGVRTEALHALPGLAYGMMAGLIHATWFTRRNSVNHGGRV